MKDIKDIVDFINVLIKGFVLLALVAGVSVLGWILFFLWWLFIA